MVTRRTASLQPYYIYDPNVSDELGGLKVKDGDDGKYVLAVPNMVQYWIDQGLLGEHPQSKLSDNAKKFLDQITRGRSKDNDARPKRVPRYSRRAQSGAPQFAGSVSPISKRIAKRRKQREKDKDKKPERTRPTTATE